MPCADAVARRTAWATCAAIVLAALVVGRACDPGVARPTARIDVVGGSVRCVLRDAAGDRVVGELELGPSGADVAIAEPGLAWFGADDAVAWPIAVRLAPGGRATVHVEPLRDVRLPDSEGDWTLVPDRTEIPAGPGARRDALQAWIDTEAPRVGRRADECDVARVPATAWWALGAVAGRPVLAHAASDAPEFRVVARDVVHVAAEPQVDGVPVPEGTLVAPGALDLAAAAHVRSAVLRGRWRGAVVRESSAWRGAEVPRAATYTLWHPRFGVAYAEPPSDGRLAARSEPGRVTFVPADGGAFSGTVAVWPTWPGGGTAFSRPADSGLRLAASAASRVVFRGLPASDYRFDHTLVPGAGASPSARLAHGTVAVRGGAAAVVRIAAEPRGAE